MSLYIRTTDGTPFREGRRLFQIVSNQEVVGHFKVYRSIANPDEFVICDLSVFPKFRGKKYGRRALRLLQRRVKAKHLWLWCYRELTPYYKEVGFKITQNKCVPGFGCVTYENCIKVMKWTTPEAN